MLAKETKIHNLIHQRNFIKEQLQGLNKDGDPSYRYLGYVYPENRKYFEKEGYDITTIAAVEALSIGKGLPLNIFTPFDGIELTPEEETASERIATDLANISAGIKCFGDLFSDLFEDEEPKEDVEHSTNEDEK